MMPWLSAAMMVLTLATVAGFGWQRGRVQSYKSTVDDIRAQLEDSRGEIEDLQRRLTRTEERAEKAETDAATCRSAMEELGKVARHEAEWVGLADLVGANHASTMTHLSAIEDGITRMLAVLQASRP